jgi:hypothetical protein
MIRIRIRIRTTGRYDGGVAMSDYDAIIELVKDLPRPVTRGALVTRIWEARGGERADWLRRVDVLVEGGALESRLWPGASRMVNTHRVFAGTRTVEFAVAKVAARITEDTARRARERAHARSGDVRASGGGASPPTAKGRVGRVSSW